REKSWPWICRLAGYELPFGLLLAGAWWAVCDAYLPAQALGDALSLTLFVGLFYFLAAGVRSRKDFDRLLCAAFAGYALVLLCGFLQYAMSQLWLPVLPGINFLMEARGLYRISSVFIRLSGISVYGAFLSLSVPAYVSWFALEFDRQKTGWKFLQLAVLALTIFNVMFSFSRALLVVLALVFIFTLLRSRCWKQFLAAGILLSALAVLLLPPVQKTVLSLFDRNDMSNRDHYMLAGISLRQIAAHPLNGWGGGHINAKLKKIDGRWVNLRGQYDTPEELRRDYNYENMAVIRDQALADGVLYIFPPHNMYLGYFLEYGFLGFLGVLLLLWTACRRLRRLPGSLARSLALGLIGFGIYGLFQDSIRAPVMAYLFWFYLLLVLKLEESLRGFNALQYGKALALAYHRVLPDARHTLAVSLEQFAKQIEFLRRRKYLFLNAEDFYRRFVAGREPLNRRVCLITFDDGYRDNLKYAWPLLRKYNIPATLFVTVNKIGGAEPYYWDFKNTAEFTDDDLPLDWAELKLLRKSGWAVGSHTLNHYELPGLDAPVSARELTLSRKILEKKLGVSVSAVCYPRGAADARILAQARAAGYSLGFLTNARADDLLVFPRIGIYAHDSFWRFRLKLFFYRMRRIYQRG
ncbi:MAG: polysaccharide deacetylase family protein, partial [Candidatus Margulisbacteria bacterium]|nr:polysaccharide deacetylase family protein [Candidatus Margulisiibacteriota bacterium]